MENARHCGGQGSFGQSNGQFRSGRLKEAEGGWEIQNRTKTDKAVRFGASKCKSSAEKEKPMEVGLGNP